MDPRTILTTLAGSHAHGINTPASDIDLLSVTVSPLESTLGIAPAVGTEVTRTSPEGVRSSAGDVECTTYELRHYMRLALQGNPNVLVPLFCSEYSVQHITQAGAELRELAPDVVSIHAVRRHLKYAESQLARMRGNGPHQARKPNRPELVEAHGYDTKYAAHALRLAWQGIDLATSGVLVLPLRRADQEFLRYIRSGEVTEEEVVALIEIALTTLRNYVDGDVRSPLPEEPDYAKINRWLVDVQLRHP